MAIVGWPATVDDSGDGVSGTELDNAFFTVLEGAVEAVVEGTVNPSVRASTIIDEVITARGSQSTLGVRLDQALDTNGNIKTFTTPPIFQIGSASPISVRPSGKIIGLTGTVTCGVGVETTLYSGTLPANSLDQTGAGRSLWIRAWGTTAANANAKTIKLTAGALEVSISSTFNNLAWDFEAEMILTGATTGDLHGKITLTSVAGNVVRATGAFDPSTSKTLAVKATGVAAADVTGFGFVVEVI